MTCLLVGWQLYVAGPGGSADGGVLIKFGARKPNFGFPQAPWRLVASMFLHGGWFHLFSNCVVLVLWGGQVCRTLGNWACLAIFFLTGIWGNLLADVYGPEALAVGASGGVAGLVLTLLVCSYLVPDHPSWSGQAKSWFQSSVAALVLAVLMAFGITSRQVSLDHWAHTGGAVSGLLLGFAGVPALRGRPGVFWLSSAILAGAACLVIALRGSSL